MSTASLRQYRRRIRSVENTKKITRAMEMVAAAKLRRFQDFLDSSRPYTERLEALLEGLLAGLPEGYEHPLLGPSPDTPALPASSSSPPIRGSAAPTTASLKKRRRHGSKAGRRQERRSGLFLSENTAPGRCRRS